MEIDRWVLAEAWIANGLSLRWGSSHYGFERSEIQNENGVQYYYEGYGVWVVIDPTPGYKPLGNTEAPFLPTADMKHELAHWLIATEDERSKQNFGLTKDSNDLEERTIAAEAVITSIINAAARITNLALQPKAAR